MTPASARQTMARAAVFSSTSRILRQFGVGGAIAVLLLSQLDWSAKPAAPVTPEQLARKKTRDTWVGGAILVAVVGYGLSYIPYALPLAIAGTVFVGVLKLLRVF